MSDDHVRNGSCNSSEYAAGGFAYGGVTTDHPSPNQRFQLANADRLDSWRLLGNCNGKIEYLYIDFCSESANTTVPRA